MYFSAAQRWCIGKAFDCAERLTSRHFDFVPREWMRRRYDVKTLAELQNEEIDEGVFAQLCRYAWPGGTDGAKGRDFHFYRVCLHDKRILDAVERGSSFIKLFPLVLYIATHELVHILRFERGESDFDLPPGERRKEESRVHAITGNILSCMADPELKRVLECFGEGYLIGESMRPAAS